MLQRLIALQQADSAFPSGSFAFSNGIEGLAALLDGLGGAELGHAVEAVLRHRWAGSDRTECGLHGGVGTTEPPQRAEVPALPAPERES